MLNNERKFIAVKLIFQKLSEFLDIFKESNYIGEYKNTHNIIGIVISNRLLYFKHITEYMVFLDYLIELDHQYQHGEYGFVMIGIRLFNKNYNSY